MTERISGPRTVFKNWEVRSGRWTGISYFWHFSFDSHSFKRLKTFLKKVSFPKQHKDSERWKVVIPQRSHSLKTSYYYTSSSETWLSDEHPYTYIKWDEQQVRSLEKKRDEGQTHWHVWSHCSGSTNFLQLQILHFQNGCPSTKQVSANGYAHHLPPPSPSSLYVLASANQRGKKTGVSDPTPEVLAVSWGRWLGFSTPKAWIDLGALGFWGREGLQWVFEDEQESARWWQ